MSIHTHAIRRYIESNFKINNTVNYSSHRKKSLRNFLEKAKWKNAKHNKVKNYSALCVLGRRYNAAPVLTALCVIRAELLRIMDIILFSAGILSILVGLIHSIVGEILIFHKLREGGLIPTKQCLPISSKNVRILWATWHIATFFGRALGGLLIQVSNGKQVEPEIIIHYVGLAMLISGLLVLFATKGKHPGWVGLCGVAILCWVV